MQLKIFLLFFVVLLLVSCGGNNSAHDGRTVFRYNEAAGISSLDPAFARSQANIWAVNQLFNGLTQLDDNLTVRPCIANSWTVSDDGLTYTFHLRNDVFFHEHPLFGAKPRKVVANDFVYSFNRITDPATTSPGGWIFSPVKRDLEGHCAFSAPDDSTFIVELSHAFPPFPGMLSMQYCSVVPHEITTHYGRDFRSNPIGTGPFYFKMWKEGVKMVLLKNPRYFETDSTGTPLPYLDAVAISFVIDKQTAFLEFVKGNLDFMSGIDASYKDELLTRSGELNPDYKLKFNLSKAPYLNTEYLGFVVDTILPQSKNNPLCDVRVRQAINYGFDRRKMMLYLRNNIGIPGTYGFIPPGLPASGTDGTYGYNYKPDKARQLLAEAGYPGGKGLPPITLSTNASYLDLCQYIQSELEAIGITLKIDVSPPGTLREQMAKSEVPFFRGSWIADYPDAENYLSLFYSPNFTPAGPNYTRFSNTLYDNLYRMSLAETNDSIRYSQYRSMDSIVMAHAPVVVLYYDEVLRFTQKNIEGLGNNPLNLLTLKYVRKQ